MATVAVARTALTAIVTAIRGIDGAGAYNHDLSDAPSTRVLPYHPDSLPVAPPCVFVSAFEIDGTPEGVPLGKQARVGRLEIDCYGGGQSDPADELYTALDLASDVDRAIMAERADSDSDLMGAVLDVWLVRAAPTEPVHIGTGVYHRVRSTYALTWRATTAGGI